MCHSVSQCVPRALRRVCACVCVQSACHSVSPELCVVCVRACHSVSPELCVCVSQCVQSSASCVCPECVSQCVPELCVVCVRVCHSVSQSSECVCACHSVSPELCVCVCVLIDIFPCRRMKTSWFSALQILFNYLSRCNQLLLVVCVCESLLYSRSYTDSLLSLVTGNH